MVHVPGIAFGGTSRPPVEQRPVRVGVRPTRLGPARQQGQPRGEDGRLDLVEAAVHARLAVVVPVRLPAVPDAFHLGGERGVAGRDRTAVAEGAEVLRWIEAVGAATPNDPRPAFARRQVGLAAILDDRQPRASARP